MHTGLFDVFHDAADQHVGAVTNGVDIDLNRWFSGVYAVPAETGPDDEVPGDGGDDFRG